MPCCTTLASYLDKPPIVRPHRSPVSTFQSQWIKLQRGTMRYIQTGNLNSHKTVVMMPDPPNTIEHMSEVIRLLSDDFRVIVFDGLGFGFSTASYAHNFSMQHNVDMIVELLHKLKVENAILALTCVAALPGLMVAKQHPRLVSGLVLGQAPSIDEARNWMKRVDFKGLMATPFVGQLALKLARKPILKEWYKNALPKGADIKEMSDIAFESFAQGARFSLASIIQAFNVTTLTPDQLIVEQNAILLWGSLDRSHRKTNKRETLDYLPNGQMVELDDCAHFPDIEKPEAFASAIREIAYA